MNAPRRFIQIVQIMLVAAIVKTTSSALSHESESKTEINVIVVLNNSNAESYCPASTYTPQESGSAEQDESTPSSKPHRRVFYLSDRSSTEQEFKDGLWRELNPDFVFLGAPKYSTDFYLRIRKMIVPFLFEKGRNVPRYKYTVLLPTKVDHNRNPSIPSILMTFKTISKFNRSEIGSADLWFMNGNYNPTFNLFRMTVRKIRADGTVATFKNIVVEGGEWFNVPVEPMEKYERLSNEDKWFYISDVDANAEFRIEIVCESCDQVYGPAMKDFNPFVVVKRKFTIQKEWTFEFREEITVEEEGRSEIPAVVEVKVNSYCYAPITYELPWAVWPSEITISFCRGTCADEPDSSCVRQSSFTDSSNVSSNCCVPTKTSPLEVIYLETPNIAVYEGIPDIIVKECGCLC